MSESEYDQEWSSVNVSVGRLGCLNVNLNVIRNGGDVNTSQRRLRSVKVV